MRLVPAGAKLVDAATRERTCLVGPNVCVKAPPYLPSLHVTEAHALGLASSMHVHAYSPACPRLAPVVRLCAMLEAALPDGPDLDVDFVARLNATIGAYKARGVHVILDVHQDAFASSNGGEGLPVWLVAQMQRNRSESYVTTPARPLALAKWASRLEWLFGSHLPLPPAPTTIGDDPWRAYSLGADSGDPRRMNLGNPSMRLNNNDGAWSRGTLLFTKQVHNIADRFYGAPRASAADRASLFEPYLAHVRMLSSLYDAHANVVAIELLNEPPLGGLDASPTHILSVRRRLFDWYADVSEALLREGAAVPLAVGDIANSVAGGAVWRRPLFAALSAPGVGSISSYATARLRARAAADKLLFAYHFYNGPLTEGASFDDFASYAKRFAAGLRGDDGGGVPTFLGEYIEFADGRNDPPRLAASLARAVGILGISAATYWQGGEPSWTGTDGWFKYAPSLYPHCIEDPGAAECARGHPGDFAAYQRTIEDNSFWGGAITGSHGAVAPVLGLLPTNVSRAATAPWAARAAGEQQPLVWTRPQMTG